MMLDVNELSVSYGRHQALDKVGLRVDAGEIVVILGANGAGKSTLLKALGGLVPYRGRVSLNNHGLSGLPAHRIVEAGLALVPEGRGIFGELTVQDNLALGAYAHRARGSADANLDRTLQLFPRLGERRQQQARTMSGGEQQMVAIGRAMMSSPLVLMLDEPSLGLSPLLCRELFRALKSIQHAGTSVLLVEQNARQSLAIADRAYLLENCRIVGEGDAQQMANDPVVQRAYLGGAASTRDSTPAQPVPDGPAQSIEHEASPKDAIRVASIAGRNADIARQMQTDAQRALAVAGSVQTLVSRASQIDEAHRQSRSTAVDQAKRRTPASDLTGWLQRIETSARRKRPEAGSGPRVHIVRGGVSAPASPDAQNGPPAANGLQTTDDSPGRVTVKRNRLVRKYKRPHPGAPLRRADETSPDNQSEQGN